MKKEKQGSMIITIENGMVKNVLIPWPIDMDVFVMDNDVAELPGELNHLDHIQKIHPIINDGVPFTDADRLIISGLTDLQVGLVYKYPHKKETTEIMMGKFLDSLKEEK